MGTRWAPARASIFQDWKKSRSHRGQASFNFHDFLFKSELWGPDGHLHAPRFFKTRQKSRHTREQANLNFHDSFDQKPIMGNRWAPARASIFQDWKKNPDSTRARPISTFMILMVTSELWETDGHLRAPRFFKTGNKSRHPRKQANFNLNYLFHK